MPIYQTGQIIYGTVNNDFIGSTAETDNNHKVTVEAFPRNTKAGDALDYQQIVIKPPSGTNFERNTSYYVKATIPKDKNFDMEFSLRLLTLTDNTPEDLDDRQNYQLIKYITVPKSIKDANNYNKVALYQTATKQGESDNDIVWDTINAAAANQPENIVNNAEAAVVLDLDEDTSISAEMEKIGDILTYYNKTYLTNKIIVWKQEYYKLSGDEFINLSNSYVNPNIVLLTYSWLVDTDIENTSLFEFTFTPLSSNYNAIYFCLVPNENVDRDIQWREDNNIYYGRYIKDPETSISVDIYKLNNIFSNIVANNQVVTNIGVWGRSELIMSINGAEIKIGPSGYYELRDYDINSLCIAAFEAEDRYTVDYQYKTIE